MRWGIIGAGDIARKQTARAIGAAPSARLEAVMRRDPQAAQAFAHEFGAAKAYSRVEQVLADPEIDAIYIATPVHLHAERERRKSDGARGHHVPHPPLDLRNPRFGHWLRRRLGQALVPDRM